jgi:hypothetical protein
VWKRKELKVLSPYQEPKPCKNDTQLISFRPDHSPAIGMTFSVLYGSNRRTDVFNNLSMVNEVLGFRTRVQMGLSVPKSSSSHIFVKQPPVGNLKILNYECPHSASLLFNPVPSGK